MEINEQTIGGRAYRFARLDTFSQIHVLRRLGPAFVGAIPAIMAFLDAPEAAAGADLSETAKAKKAEVLGELIRGVPSIVSAFSAMDDDSVEYVVNKCFTVTHVQQGQGWSPLRKNGVTMFQDLDLSTTGQIVFQVLKESLGGFFPTELPKAFVAAAPAQSSPTSETGPTS
jgi:hypothetical protein